MKSFTIAVLLNLALVAYAVPPFDPAGAKNVGNGHGGQFIGGQCLSNADCGSGCCANPTGICSGVGAQLQAGKTGCGFSSTGASPPAASPSAAAAPSVDAPTHDGNAGHAAASPAHGGPPFDPSGTKNVGNGKAVQFIGGQCLSAADCASGCCAGPSGICSGLGAQTQAGKTGCGFVASGLASSAASPSVDTTPDAATSSAADAAPADSGSGAKAATAPTHGGPPFDPSGTKNVGNGKAVQFIGGQCLSAADCASGCCAGPSGICSGLGAQKQAGKTGCGFVASGLASSAASPLVNTTPSDAGSGAKAATAPANGGPPFDPAGVKNVGNGKAGQFIGGQCLNAADCGSGCCAGPSGICSGPGAQFQKGKTGCGFVSSKRLVRF